MSTSRFITLVFSSFSDSSEIVPALISCFEDSFFSIFNFPPETEPRTAPTSTVSPSLEFISDNVPLIGEGTSKFTLSVSSSTMASSTST